MPVQLMLRSEGDSQTTPTRIEGRSEDFDFESNGQPLKLLSTQITEFCGCRMNCAFRLLLAVALS